MSKKNKSIIQPDLPFWPETRLIWSFNDFCINIISTKKFIYQKCKEKTQKIKLNLNSPCFCDVDIFGVLVPRFSSKMS